MNLMKWEAEAKGYTCNDCYLSMQNCHDKSICCEDETGLCDWFEECESKEDISSCYEKAMKETLLSNYITGSALKEMAKRIVQAKYDSAIKYFISLDGLIYMTDLDITGTRYIKRIYDESFNEIYLIKYINKISSGYFPDSMYATTIEELAKGLTRARTDVPEYDIKTLKKKIKYCKNPLEKKRLEKELNTAYKNKKKKKGQ